MQRSLASITLATSFLFACVDSDPQQPELTPEQEAALKAALDDAGGKGDGLGLSFYRSHYVNLAIAGTTTSSKPFALVAGKHGQNFPFFDARSKFDNVLVMLGADTFVISARDLPGLKITVSPTAHGSTAIGFHGTARRADGTLAMLDLDVSVSDTRFAAKQLGRPYDFLDTNETPGMRWVPHQLIGTTGTVAVDGVSSQLQAVNGELEVGDLANLRAPELAISYDYLAIASAGYSYVAFTSHALQREGVLGTLVDWYMTHFASAELTLEASAEHAGNTRGVDATKVTVLAHDIVDLGPATLDRQLVQARDRNGKIGYGLREVFAAK